MRSSESSSVLRDSGLALIILGVTVYGIVLVDPIGWVAAQDAWLMVGAFAVLLGLVTMMRTKAISWGSLALLYCGMALYVYVITEPLSVVDPGGLLITGAFLGLLGLVRFLIYAQSVERPL